MKNYQKPVIRIKPLNSENDILQDSGGTTISMPVSGDPATGPAGSKGMSQGFGTEEKENASSLWDYDQFDK